MLLAVTVALQAFSLVVLCVWRPVPGLLDGPLVGLSVPLAVSLSSCDWLSCSVFVWGESIASYVVVSVVVLIASLE